MFQIESVSETDTGVQVRWHDHHESFYHDLWLRDSCRCPDCFQDDTLSLHGSHHPLGLPLSPTRETIRLTEESELEVRWGGEESGHQSVFDASWLRVHCQNDPAIGQRPHRTLWDASLEIPRFEYQAMMNEDEVLLAWSQHMVEFGVSIVDSAPRDEKSFRALVERVGPLRQRYHPTNVFTLDTTDNVAKAIQHAYQLGGLRNHTDLTAYDIQGGMQFLECLHYENSKSPGEGSSTLVDGFKLAEVLKTEQPQFFELLTQEYIPTGRRRMLVEEKLKEGESNGKKYEWEAYRRNHIINIDERGAVYQIRYNHNTRAPLDISYDKIEEMLAAYRAFTAMLDAPEYNAKFLVQPGQVLVADNWRVLHGRTAIVSASLRRVLLGAYIEEESFRSRRRLLLGMKSGMADKWLMGCSDRALEMLAERTS